MPKVKCEWEDCYFNNNSYCQKESIELVNSEEWISYDVDGYLEYDLRIGDHLSCNGYVGFNSIDEEGDRY